MFRGPWWVSFLQWGCTLERASAEDWRLEQGGSSGSDGGGFDVQPQRVGPSLGPLILISDVVRKSNVETKERGTVRAPQDCAAPVLTRSPGICWQSDRLV